MESQRRKLEAAGRALVRVRLAEQRAPDGSKLVWHQAGPAGEGVEVVSRVNWVGRTHHQEMTLPGGVVVWDRDGALRTGAVDQKARKLGLAAADALRFDPVPAPELLEDALVVADACGDRYLRHFAAVVRQRLLQSDGTGDTVTRAVTAGAIAPVKPRGWLARLLGR